MANDKEKKDPKLKIEKVKPERVPRTSNVPEPPPAPPPPPGRGG